MNFKTKLTGIILTILMGTSIANLSSQETQSSEISDAELKQFAEAYKKTQEVNQDAQEQMMKVLEAEDMSVEKYTEINNAINNPETQTEVSDEDMAKFKKIVSKFEAIQKQSQEKMQKAIVKTGMSLERYQQIFNLVQTDPELQKRLQEFLV